MNPGVFVRRAALREEGAMERAALRTSHRAAKHAIAWLFGFALSASAASTHAQSSRSDAHPPYEHEYQMLSAARTEHDAAAIVAAARFLGRHAQRNRGIDAYLTMAATVETLAEIDRDDAALPFANALIARPIAFVDTRRDLQNTITRMRVGASKEHGE